MSMPNIKGMTKIMFHNDKKKELGCHASVRKGHLHDHRLPQPFEFEDSV